MVARLAASQEAAQSQGVSVGRLPSDSARAERHGICHAQCQLHAVSSRPRSLAKKSEAILCLVLFIFGFELCSCAWQVLCIHYGVHRHVCTVHARPWRLQPLVQHRTT
jgi:hypothetical protein